MLLYLVQHAEAHPKEADQSRSLSEKGISDITRVAEYAGQISVSVHQIIHSGKMRAFQTAQVLADHVIVDMEVLESDGLLPIDDPVNWYDRIAKMNNDIMLVGHLPYLAKLTGLLICGSKDKSAVNFENSCIVCMKRSDEGIWAIEWIVKPGMVR